MLNTSAITDLREALVTDLGAVDVPVFLGKPRAVGAKVPVVIVTTPESQSITSGQFQGWFEVRMDIWVVVKMVAEDEAGTLASIDKLAGQVLYNTADWALLGIDPPELLDLDGSDFPGAVIHIAKQVQLFDAS